MQVEQRIVAKEIKNCADYFNSVPGKSLGTHLPKGCIFTKDGRVPKEHIQKFLLRIYGSSDETRTNVLFLVNYLDNEATSLLKIG